MKSCLVISLLLLSLQRIDSQPDNALPCGEDNLSCPNSLDPNNCLSRSQLCDGTEDCMYGIEEGRDFSNLDCNGQSGNPREYRCAVAKESVQLEALCDGHNNCTSGEDEIAIICENKCRLPYYGGCDYTRECHSYEFSQICGFCLPGFSVGVSGNPLSDPCLPLCSQLIDIDNGMVTFSGNFIGDIATYNCDSGFELIGDAMTTCTQVDANSATFQPAAPVCRRVAVTIGLEQATYSVGEADGSQKVCVVVKNGKPDSEILVSFRTEDSTAVAGTDYESLLTTPTFTTETDRVCYDIQIIDDDIPEEQKLLNLVLATEDRSINLEPAIGSLTIKDDDGVTVTIGLEQATYSVGEADGSQKVCVVVKNGKPDREILVSLRTEDNTAVAGTDYESLLTTPTFTTETDQVCYDIKIIDDNIPEEQKLLNLVLATDDGFTNLEPAIGSLTIADDDDVVIVNDTALGTAAFTVPVNVPDLSDFGLSLCYEVEGRSQEWFNLITDKCTSVNAHYFNVSNDMNIIDEIAIRAVDATGNCREILVDYTDCTVELDGMPLNKSGSISNNGLRIRQFPQRVRVAVPNCREQSLVMWITWQTIQVGVFTVESIRFDVLRGLNYGHRDSHGIIGQFWNVPIQLLPIGRALFNVTLEGKARSFTARLGTRDQSEFCLFAGNNQGEPVIEKEYTRYIVPSAFSEEGYQFGRFEAGMCM